MYVDENGNMPKWAQWLIGVSLIVGAISGAAVGTITGAFMSAGNQIIANGFENFDWLEVGKGALAGGIAGGIASGIFGGSQHVLSTKKIDAGVSGISKAKARLDDAHKSLSNVKK